MPFLPDLPTVRVPEVAADPAAVVLLPIAAVEQHGPHLPLLTDTLIAEAIARKVDDGGGLPIWTLPTLAYGKSNEHLAFPGTITLTSETLMRVLDEISASVARAGFGRLAFLNTHGGNTALLQVAARDARVRHGLMVATLQPNPTAAVLERGEVQLPPDEARYGLHAGRVETAVLLRLRPDLVRMESARGSPPNPFAKDGRLGFAGLQSVAWTSDDLAANGVLGDPAGATAEEGALFFAESVRIVRQALLEFSRLDFPKGDA